MRCSEVRDLILQRAPLLEPGVEAHLQSCPACQALAEDGAALGQVLGADKAPAAATLDRLRAGVVAQLEADKGPLAWLRARRGWQRLAAATALAALLAGATLALTPRVDLDVFPRLRMFAAVGLYLVGGGLVLHLVLRPLHRAGLPGPIVAAALGAAALLPWLLASLPAAHALHPASLEGAGDDFASRALACYLFGLGLGAPLLVALLVLDRAGHRSLMRALLAAAAAGLLGNLALQLHCPIVHPSHLLAGHASAALSLLALYFVVTLIRRALLGTR